jgi:hypothetical protein
MFMPIDFRFGMIWSDLQFTSATASQGPYSQVNWQSITLPIDISLNPSGFPDKNKMKIT